MMTKAQFDAEVLTFLHTDGARRGLEAFRTAFIRAGIADLATYIPEYAGQGGLSSGDLTLLDSECAEAVAEFVKSKIVRAVDRDIALSREHFASYVTLRRRLFLRVKEARSTDLTIYVGKPFTLNLTARRGTAVIPLYGEVWFTIKLDRATSDERAAIRLTRGTDCGVEVTDEEAGTFTVTITAEQTNDLASYSEYIWEVQVQGDDGALSVPDGLFGIVRPQIPITRAVPSCST